MKRTRIDNEQIHRRLTRRAILVGGLQGLFVIGLGARMRHLQVEQADAYRLLADENRINLHLIPPARGEIFDRNGVPLAKNAPSYRVVIVRENAGDVAEVLARLAQVIPLEPEAQERALKDSLRGAPFVPVAVAENVSWDDLAKVSVNAPALPGIAPEVGLSRVYPMGSDFAHVIGYVGPVSDYNLNQIEDPDPLLRIPRFQIGKVGVEAKHEDNLRGKAGTSQVEVNATGRIMRELSRQEGRPGADV